MASAHFCHFPPSGVALVRSAGTAKPAQYADWMAALCIDSMIVYLCPTPRQDRVQSVLRLGDAARSRRGLRVGVSSKPHEQKARSTGATIMGRRSNCRCLHKTVEVPPLAAHPQGPCWMLLDPVGDHTRSGHGRSIANNLLGPRRRPAPVSVPRLMPTRKNPSCPLDVGTGLIKHARGCYGRHSSGHTALPRFLQYSDPGNSNAPGPLPQICHVPGPRQPRIVG